jgi:proteasome lid subunit RPN8/RPN11
MKESDKIRIKIKQIKKKATKGKLPARIDRDYPAGLPAVFVHRAALQSLQTYAASDLDYELGGVLIGKIGRSSRRFFCEIQGFIPARKGKSHRASFEFTNEAQHEMHDILESEHKGQQIVGWFHTHPGYGIFLSGADQFIDEHYFREKYHIAVVIDPTKSGIEIGAFVWSPEGGRVRVPYYEL